MNFIRARVESFAPNVALLIGQKTDSGSSVMVNAVYETVADGLCQEPSLRISLTAAQELMDDLWQCGLRPSEGSGSAGSLRATQEHLADMRRLVFDGKP
jgi:hypothetical protein